jgi:glycosyltransferase involved in cell wall biosynthesis
MRTKVSICVPAYNQPDFLRRALNSIKEQSFQDYEVIITDDSTNNEVRAVVSEFLSDARYMYCKNNERKGTPGNWNEAIQYAKAPLIKLLHHDDWFSNNDSLEIFVRMLEENPLANFAFSSSLNFDANQQLVSKNIPSENQLLELKNNSTCLLWGNFVGAPSATIFRKSNAPKFDENLRWLVDIDFYIAVLKANPLFVFSELPLTSTTSRSDFQVSASYRHDGLLQLNEYYYLRSKLKLGIFNFPFTLKFIKLILKVIDMPSSRCALLDSNHVKNPCLEMRLALFLNQLKHRKKC